MHRMSVAEVQALIERALPIGRWLGFRVEAMAEGLRPFGCRHAFPSHPATHGASSTAIKPNKTAAVLTQVDPEARNFD